MNRDELFEALKSEPTQTAWELLVSQAVAEGISLDEIRDMLDYLENSRRPQNETKRANFGTKRWLGCFMRRASKA